MANIKLSIDNACVVRTTNLCRQIEEVVTGESFTIEWEVFNQGRAFSRQPIKERVFLSRNINLNKKEDIRLLNDENLRSLRKNGSYQVEDISLVITTEDLQDINFDNRLIYLLVTNNRANNYDPIALIPESNTDPQEFITNNFLPGIPIPEPATGMLFGTILMTMGIFSLLKMSSKGKGKREKGKRQREKYI